MAAAMLLATGGTGDGGGAAGAGTVGAAVVDIGAAAPATFDGCAAVAGAEVALEASTHEKTKTVVPSCIDWGLPATMD